MSRSGYSDDMDDQWAHIMYRGAVASATRGARGQALFRDLLDAMDKMPQKALVAGDLERADGAVCALGAAGKARGVDVINLDPEDAEGVAAALDIAPALAREVAFMNDEGAISAETPEARFARMRRWVAAQITPDLIGERA